MMKLAHIALCVLLAITTQAHAVEANDPAKCRHLIDQLPSVEGQNHLQTTDAIELLVWNVQKFENPAAIEWLKGTSSHIIFTQESIASIQQKFAEDLKAANTFAPGYRTLSNETSGVGIVTTLQTLMSCAWQHEEPWLLTPKATLVSALRTADQVMIAVNLHAVNFSIGTQELRDQLDAISAVIAQHQGPVVVAGDFNTWSKARTEILKLFAEEHDLSATAFDPDYRVRPFSYPLDHILTKNVEVLNTRSEQSDLSDHTPLILTIKPLGSNNPQLAYSNPTKIERPLTER
jgi:endonuclease/exonuclease/phosphatase (EEP) superfamily protein YafD